MREAVSRGRLLRLIVFSQCFGRNQFGFACTWDVFWSIAFSLAFATTACMDGSFEANSPGIRSHLAQATAFH